MVFYVNSQEKESSSEIAFLLRKCILHHPGPWSELIFLCIGSDRVTGDCPEQTFPSCVSRPIRKQQ